MASGRPAPATPRVISPSPTPSDISAKDYFGPVTRSAARSSRTKSPASISENKDSDGSGSDRDPERRARTRSRSPGLADGSMRRMSGLTAIKPRTSASTSTVQPIRRRGEQVVPNGTSNGHLSPASASKGKWSWRELSRSPSPLGLIPIHKTWRQFIHKHEIPRKALHVSIGFITLYLYAHGIQQDAIHPVLLCIFIPVAAVDVARHNSRRLNQAYIKVMGALMRETEVDGWNGTLSYLLGAWLVMRICPKDVAVMSVLLLSWCDTAASTFGRLWGRYTPRIRKGKSLAGSIAALVCGVVTAVAFWGFIAPHYEQYGYDTGKYAFAFQGSLSLPENIRQVAGLTKGSATIGGVLALVVMSLWTGFVGAASEAIDLWGLDDNFTIPLLSAVGLWSFLRTYT